MSFNLEASGSSMLITITFQSVSPSSNKARIPKGLTGVTQKYMFEIEILNITQSKMACDDWGRGGRKIVRSLKIIEDRKRI